MSEILKLKWGWNKATQSVKKKNVLLLYARIEPDVKEQAELTEAELNAELEKGYADMAAGRTKPVKQVFTDIRKDYGLWFRR